MRGQAEKPLKRFPSHWFLCTQLKLVLMKRPAPHMRTRTREVGKACKNDLSKNSVMHPFVALATGVTTTVERKAWKIVEQPVLERSAQG